MTLRLAMGTAVVATMDRTPSVIVGLIIPIDDDLLFDTDAAITLAAKLAASCGKTGEAAVIFAGDGLTAFDPGDDFDPETPTDPRDLGDP